MTRKMKAILVLFFAAEIVNSAKVGVLKGRIADLETQRDIYASRAQNWLDRAVEDEEVIDSLQIRLDETADRKIELTEAGTFFCTAYCTEQYEHICGEGHGITASGQPIQAGVTVAADTSIFPYGTVLYIEGVGIRIVQDKGAAIQGKHLDVAVDTHENAEKWNGCGNHRVWVLKDLQYISVTNFDFTDTFTDAVEAKVKAQQEKEKAETDADKRRVEAQATADADLIAANAEAEKSKVAADAELYVAEKKAEANRALNDSLNSNLLEYYKITDVESRWNGELPAYVGDGNSIPIINGIN